MKKPYTLLESFVNKNMQDSLMLIHSIQPHGYKKADKVGKPIIRFEVLNQFY